MAKTSLWAEISLDNFKHNMNVIKQQVGPNVHIMAVVKRNAYGHGMVTIAKYAQEWGASALAVASVEEGVELRREGVHLPILVLGHVLPTEIPFLLEYKIMPSIVNIEMLNILISLCKKRHKQARIHIRVDTTCDMTKQVYEQVIDLIQTAVDSPFIEVDGIYTHLASAYQDNAKEVEKQLSMFETILGYLSDKNVHVPFIHAANSPSIFLHQKAHFNMVRPGTAIYGIYFPGWEATKELKPVMQLKSRIGSINQFHQEYFTEYSGKCKMDKPSKIANVLIGYADAHFLLSINNGYLLVNNMHVPIRGKACMDRVSIDITDANNISVGDEVVIFGSQGDKAITHEEVMRYYNLSVSNCESICFLGEGVDYVYILDNKIAETKYHSSSFNWQSLTKRGAII